MFFKYALTLLISTVAIMQFIQVVARYILEIPLSGLEELLVYPTLWLYMLGSVNASRTDTQITANVLDIFMKTTRQQKILKTISYFLSTIIVLWLTSWAWDYENYARRVWKDSPTLYIPTYYAEVALFIGLSCMSFYTIIKLIQSFKAVIQDDGTQGIKL